MEPGHPGPEPRGYGYLCGECVRPSSSEWPRQDRGHRSKPRRSIGEPPDTTLSKGTSAVSACQALLKRKAIDSYEWVAHSNAGIDDLRYTLLELGPVCVGSNWYTSMDSPTQVGDQFYMRVNYSSTVRGGHEYVIDRIDLDPEDGSEPYYTMLNSWGTGWGRGGTARFKLNDLETLIFEGWGDAVLIHELPRLAA